MQENQCGRCRTVAPFAARSSAVHLLGRSYQTSRRKKLNQICTSPMLLSPPSIISADVRWNAFAHLLEAFPTPMRTLVSPISYFKTGIQLSDNSLDKRDLKTSQAAQVFFRQRMHQPFGLISPATFLQELGATKRLQPSHCRSAFGVL